MDAINFLQKPEPYVVQPKQEHKQTFILLHGRGDSANAFGAMFLATELPDETNLRQLFPNAKFIFLQAPKRTLRGPKWPQWFEVISLNPGAEESDVQAPDLKNTIELVHNTLKEEIKQIGADNVVLGGLSQGCASSLASLLLWDGPPFAACIGMAGWLPFRKTLEDQARSTGTTSVLTDSSPVREAVSTLAKRLGLSDSKTPSMSFRQIPVFLGHGIEDEVVVRQLGIEAAVCLESMQVKVTYNDYIALHHWYSPLMLQDIVHFLRVETKWFS